MESFLSWKNNIEYKYVIALYIYEYYLNFIIDYTKSNSNIILTIILLPSLAKKPDVK